MSAWLGVASALVPGGSPNLIPFTCAVSRAGLDATRPVQSTALPRLRGRDFSAGRRKMDSCGRGDQEGPGFVAGGRQDHLTSRTADAATIIIGHRISDRWRDDANPGLFTAPCDPADRHCGGRSAGL